MKKLLVAILALVLILALGGVSGSVILAWVVYRFFFMRRDESSVS